MAPRATKLVCGSRLVRLTLALIATGTLLLGYALAERGGSQTASASPGLAFRLDHFQCYSIKPFGSFRPRRVALVDQFGRSKALVSQLTSFCAPVRKNTTPVRNPLAHLACYPIERRTPAFRTRVATISNQFEKVAVRIVKPVQLCVPSGKSVVPAPAPQPATGLDHYQCYSVKPLRRLRARRVVLVDQFGRSKPTVVRMVSLCAPVRKNNSPVRNKRDHLACYQLKTAQRFSPRRVTIVNQFGTALLTARAPQTLCLPSLKRVITKPDLTVSIANQRAQVLCPGGPGTCTMTVTFTIANLSPVGVTTPFDVLVQADPGQKAAFTVSSFPGAATRTFGQPLGPDNNCYDPDCTVTVTVDDGNAVAESNEANNSDTRTDIG